MTRKHQGLRWYATLLAGALTLAGMISPAAPAAQAAVTASAPRPAPVKTAEPAEPAKPVRLAKSFTADARHVCAVPERGHAACMALLRTNVKPHRGVRPDQAPAGYGPSDFQSAYDLPSATAGSGETVAVVDAYNDPDIASDLAAYRTQYGLPACTTASGCFQVLNEDGQTSPLPPDAGTNGWDVEESLDVDMVSAICPNCHILLVEANSNEDSDLYTAEDEAVTLGAKYVSNSWASCEYSGETADDQYFNHPGVAITAASGDYGYDNYLEDCDTPSYPAASQYVTSVGGTTLTQDPSVPRGWTETTWSPDPDATGSGCSQYEPKPAWQTDTGCANRMTNDVSADADPNTGAAIYDSYSEGGWLEVGGTSEATPIIAATYALAGAPAAGTYPSSYPYADPSALNDITSGTNYDTTCSPAYSCTAGPGYDGPTGLGTPDGTTAFTPAYYGTVAGTVTDASTGQPLAGAQVQVGTRTVTTNSSGQYSATLPAASYTVTVSDYDHVTQTVSDVQLSQSQTTTENFALALSPSSRTLSGTVTDGSGHKWPLYAEITIPGDPNGPFYTDPYTGAYSMSLPSKDSYTLQVAPVSLAGYANADLSVHIGTANLVKNIKLRVDASACDADGYGLRYNGAGTEFTGWTKSTPQDGWTVKAGKGGNGGKWLFGADPTGEGEPPGSDGQFAIADSNYYAEGTLSTSLVSPVVDLSRNSSPVVSFDTWYNEDGTLPESAEVELSLDGGKTWASIWKQTTSSVEGPVTIPVPQAAGQSDVQVRFTYTGTNDWWWSLDNVVIGSGPTCSPIVHGGLVAGQVSDANTTSAVDGATVASLAQPAETTTTADAPGAGDGFYELFTAGTGSQRFAASDAVGYAPATQRARVTANTVTRQDFTLQAGNLAVSTAGLSATVAMGKSAAKTVRFTNTGTEPVQVGLYPGPSTGPSAATRQQAAAARVPLERIKAHVTPGFVKPRAHPAATQRRQRPGGTAATRQAVATWDTLPSYPFPVQDNAVALDPVTGDVYSIGGYDGDSGADTGDGYVYDPATQQWSQIADAPVVTQQAKAAIVNGILYLIGGWDSAGDALSSVYAYDLATGVWSQVAPLPSGAAASGVAVLDGQIYVIGGCVDDACDETTAAYRYDPAANTWTTIAAYPTATSYQACAGIDGEVACAGGYAGYTGMIIPTYLYDPASNTWTQGATMPYYDWGMTSGAANGDLQVAGGAGNDGVTNQAAQYNPVTGTWSALPNASYAEYRGGGSCGLYQVGGNSGGPDGLAEVLPGYSGCGAGVPWLSQGSSGFALAPRASATVTVTLNTAGLTAPGTYTADLAISTNTPYQFQPVAITLQAKPGQWGGLSGTVTDASTGDPIAPGATVQVCARYDRAADRCATGAQTYTLGTGPSGGYQWWLPPGDSPVQVIVSAVGYQPQAKIVKIVRGTVTTLNFALQEDSG